MTDIDLWITCTERHKFHIQCKLEMTGSAPSERPCARGAAAARERGRRRDECHCSLAGRKGHRLHTGDLLYQMERAVRVAR